MDIAECEDIWSDTDSYQDVPYIYQNDLLRERGHYMSGYGV